MANGQLAALTLAVIVLLGPGVWGPQALAETAAQPIRIAQTAAEIRLVGGRPPGPGELALPKAGKRLEVDVPPGAQVMFVDRSFSPADVQLDPKGDDLEMVLKDGGILVLRGFLAEPPDGTKFASIELADGTVIPAQAFWAAAAPAEVAAGSSAAGGGEVFGLVRVVWWLLDRVDLVGKAEAAGASSDATTDGPGTTSVAVAPAPGDGRVLDQVLAQMLIARDGEIAAAAAAFRENAHVLEADIKRRVQGGGASHVDVPFSESFSLNADLEQEEAAFALTLAVDAHQDRFGERLEKATYRPWPAAAPDDLAAISAQVGPERRAEARRQWRVMKFARKTLPMLEQLLTLALDVHDGYAQQFEVAQRTLAEVDSAVEAVYRVRVRLAERKHELKAAEAWLLAATGQLPESIILRPGWQ